MGFCIGSTPGKLLPVHVTAQALVVPNLSVTCSGLLCCCVFGFLVLCLGFLALYLASWRCVCCVWIRGVVFVVLGFIALGLVLVARPHSVFRRAFPPAGCFLLLFSLRNVLFASRLVPSQPSISLSSSRTFGDPSRLGPT